MLLNYLKTAYRNLTRDRFFSLLNLFGLTVGITAFLLIVLYVRFELSFDQFHEKGDRIRAFHMVYSTAEGKAGSDRLSFLAGKALEAHLPDFEEVVQLSGGYDVLLTVDQQGYNDHSWFYSDNSIFEVFDFPVKEGKPRLDEANTAVITESLARRYFGNVDPIGKTIKKDKKEEYLITAIAEDTPANSYIQFGLLLSDQTMIKELADSDESEDNKWGSSASTYFLLAKDVSDEQVLEKMTAVADEHFSSSLFRAENGDLRFTPRLMPYEDIHLRSGFKRGLNSTSDIRYVYLFSSIAFLILLIACINYVNLSTARSLKRAKETGLRKVIGATRGQLIRHYLAESLTLTTISVFLAFAIAERILPYYNSVIDRELSLQYNGLEFIFTMVVVNLVVGLAAGAYPALKLSAFKPIEALRGAKGPGGKKRVRRGLVLIQFIVAQLLIVATIVIQSQLNYLQNKDLGYNKEHVLYIDTYGELTGHKEAFMKALQDLPSVTSASYSEGIFTNATITFLNLNELEGNEDADPKEYVVADLFNADAGFLDVMEIDIIEGRGFIDSIASDRREAILINETAAKIFGWENPIGKKIVRWDGPKYVIGVMKDFHNESLRAEITPTFVVLDPDVDQYANVRILPQDVPATIDKMEEAWSQLVPGRPFEYTFYDDKYDQHYKSERQLGEIFFIFASLAIGISLLGLVGLTAFTTEQRLKEVGIRKVLGASVKKLILLLSNEFVLLCSIAFVITTPVTYYLMQDWLEVFKYRIDIGVPVYLVALVASLGVGWLVVCLQSVRVARSNPANVLRNNE